MKQLWSYFLAAFGVLGATTLQAAFAARFGLFGLPVNSFPLSFTLLCLVLLQGNTKRLIAVPLESITVPEDHLRRVKGKDTSMEFNSLRNPNILPTYSLVSRTKY